MTFEALNQTVLSNTLSQWAVACGVVIVTVVVLRIVQNVVARRTLEAARKTKNYWDDGLAAVIAKTQLLFLLILGLFVGIHFLDLADPIQSVLSTVFQIGLFVQMGVWGMAFLATVMDANRKQALENNPSAVTTMNFVALALKVVLWSTVLFLALDNLGINITALVASLGIGGIAVALAMQNILSDLFASLSIVLDKPFVNKDFLIIGDLMGSVEHIGLKTTRIRSLSGEQLIFSNSDLLSSRIRNYGRMYERRVVFGLGVTYQTPRDKLKQIPVIIRKAVEEQNQTRFDRSHFMKYGDYALQFETVYYVLSNDYNVYMDIQQSIYFAIHQCFEEQEIEFAYPTQTLIVSESVEKNTNS